MINRLAKTVLSMSILGAVIALAPMLVHAADIADGGGFFSSEAIAKANQSIRDLEQKSGYEIRIETYATTPNGNAEAVSKMEPKQREVFFSNWIHDRAEATKSRGLLVLICKEPSHLRIWAGTPIQRAGFGAAQGKVIRETLLSGFKAKDYDVALSNTVTELESTFKSLNRTNSKAAPATGSSKHLNPIGAPSRVNNEPVHRAPTPAPRQSPWGGLIVVLMLVIGGIFVMSLIGRLFGGGRSYGPSGSGQGGYGYGGGGFMSGLTGGIFGAMAGNWLYDQFSGHHASAGETHSSNDFSNRDDSSNGGWFDSGSGSSDSGFSGGTDFGGGDFGGGGGGDVGGGGDF